MHSRKGKKEKREKANEMPPALNDDCLRMPFPWCSGYHVCLVKKNRVTVIPAQKCLSNVAILLFRSHSVKSDVFFRRL